MMIDSLSVPALLALVAMVILLTPGLPRRSVASSGQDARRAPAVVRVRIRRER
jgi:hypothetical protein